MKLDYQFCPIKWAFYMENVGGAAVDSQLRIHAATNGDQPISVFDQDGNLVDAWGKGVIQEAHGIYIDRNDCAYVPDSKLHIVMKFSPQHELLLELGTRGVPSDTGVVNGDFKTIQRGAGPFNVPSKVATADNGEVFVCDGYGNARVHRFSPDGKLLASWGEPGAKPGEFHIPHGIGVDNSDRVYVADRENDRVQIFDVNGKLLDIWTDISRPDGLCVKDDLIYVAELGHRMFIDNVLYTPGTYDEMQWSRVRIFAPDGTEVCRFGGPDASQEGNLYAAHGIFVDRENSIYVAEATWPDSEYPKPAGLHGALQKFKRIG